MSSLSLSVVVVTQQGSASGLVPVAQMCAARRGQGMELVVVMADTTPDRQSATPGIDADVVLRLDGHASSSMARNIGASCASGEVIAFMDDDDQLTIRELEGIRQHLAERPEVSGVLFSGRAASTDDATVLVVRAATLLTVGGFDPDISSGEVVELLDRCERCGNRIGRLSDLRAGLVVADAGAVVADRPQSFVRRRPTPAPIVSVVIPVFNAGRYLSEALESVVAQDLDGIEIIVIDDASTDDSLAVATQLAAGRPNVRVVSHPGGGPGAARNLGLLLARGRFIAMLDADDIWVPGKLAEQLTFLEARPELDVVFGSVEEFVSPELPPDEARRFHPRRAGSAHANSALLARRAAMARVGLHRRGRNGGDYPDWYIRAVQAGLAMGAIERVVVWRRLHASNQSHRLDTIRTQYFDLLRGAIATRRRQR